MGNTAKTVSTTNAQDDNTIDLYKNQLNYHKFIAKKMSVYRILFVVASVISLLTMFLIPIFRYRVHGNVNKNQPEIYGEYSLFYIIQKFCKGELGENTLYNVGMFLFLCLTLVTAIYLVAGAFMNFVLKLSSVPKFINKDALEVASTLVIVYEFAALMCCRININGAADNLIGFWILLASAIVMICTSIPLITYYDKNHK